MILIAKEEGDLSDSRLTGYFDRVDPIVTLSLKTGWSTTKTYLYRVAYGYRGVENQKPISPVTEEPKMIEIAPVPTPEPLAPEQIPQFTPAPPEMNRS